MCKKMIFFKIFFLINFIFLSPSYSASLDELVKNCRVDSFCDALDASHPGDSAKEIAESNKCFQKKVQACFAATTLAGFKVRANGADLSRVIIYGKFCGWRNLAKNPDGSPINWKNEAEALAATKNTVAIDAIDEICKAHDIQYFTAPYNICDADKAFIKSMQDLAWDYREPLTDKSREVAMAMAGAIQKNSHTCRLIGMLKRNHLWN